MVPDYDRDIIKNINKENDSKQHHNDRIIRSNLFDNLRISFYWRNLIAKNLIADFKHWALSKDKAPDFILLGELLSIISRDCEHSVPTISLETRRVFCAFNKAVCGQSVPLFLQKFVSTNVLSFNEKY